MAKKKWCATLKKTVAQRNRVLIEFIQDRSGSMDKSWQETLSGFKVFVDDLAKQKGADHFLSLTTFDTLVDRPLSCVPIKDVKPAILAEYGPRGGTALYDAVGDVLTGIDSRAAEFDKIIVVIVTDGQENSSRIFEKDAVNTLVDARLQKGNYTFTYLGTQPETWDDASKIGFAAGQTVVWDQGHTGSTYRVMAQSLGNFTRSAEARTDSLFSTYANASDLEDANMKVKSGQ